MSSEEKKFSNELDEIFKGWQIIKNWRPNKLKNIKTDRNLEIDYYIGKYRVGIEYQGAVHFKNIDRYKNDSDSSREHDIKKYDLSMNINKRGVKDLTIIEFFYTDLKGDFRTNFINRINATINFYNSKKIITSVSNLIKLLCFVETGIKFKNENILSFPMLTQYAKRINNANRILMFESLARKRKRKRRRMIKLNVSADKTQGITF